MDFCFREQALVESYRSLEALVGDIGDPERMDACRYRGLVYLCNIIGEQVTRMLDCAGSTRWEVRSAVPAAVSVNLDYLRILRNTISHSLYTDVTPSKLYHVAKDIVLDEVFESQVSGLLLFLRIRYRSRYAIQIMPLTEVQEDQSSGSRCHGGPHPTILVR